jgi:hypothetical protein
MYYAINELKKPSILLLGFLSIINGMKCSFRRTNKNSHGRGDKGLAANTDGRLLLYI